ncbi:MAG: ABC transporter permease subunit [Bacillota bacterium]
MKILIKKEFKAAKWKFIIFFALLTIMAITIIIQYPFVKNLLEQGILDGMPKWIVEGAEQQINFNVYLSANWYDKNLIQISVIFAILLSMSVISSEVEDHTLEFLLTRPMSRYNLFFKKTLIQLLISLVIIITTTVILAISAMIENYDVNLLRLLVGIIPLFAKFFIIYSLALLISLYLDDQVKSGLLTAVMLFVFWGIGAFWELSFLNIFSYAPITPYYLNGIFPWGAVIKLFMLAIILYGLSLYRFKNRDF